MKKFILMFALIMGMVVSANANSTLVDNGTFKDNWYVGLGGGSNVWNDADSWILFKSYSKAHNGKENTWSSKRPFHVNILIGKMINPYLGVEADYKMIYNLDAHHLTGNVVFNLNNIINGYDGKKDFFEVELLGGLGWYHNFSKDDKNAVGVRGALRANFNLTQHFAITLTPEYLWFHKKFLDDNKSKQFVNWNVGVKWTIPTKRGGFPLKELRDQDEIDGLNAKINQLAETVNSQAKSIEDLTETIKNLTENASKVKATAKTIPSVTFEKGKSDVDATKVTEIVKALKDADGSIVLTGTTSPEGKEKFNKKLALSRAEAVKKALVGSGIDESRITIKNDYESQRAVTISVK